MSDEAVVGMLIIVGLAAICYFIASVFGGWALVFLIAGILLGSN